jgi:hypothetical protein
VLEEKVTGSTSALNNLMNPLMEEGKITGDFFQGLL